MTRVGDIGTWIAQQRGHLSLWTPVCLGLGSAIYFALRFEPAPALLAVLAVCATGIWLLLSRIPEDLRPLVFALVLIVAGGLLAALRTHMLAAPVLEFRYYGPIEGRIIEVDRSQSDKPRLMLDRVVLERTPNHRTPERVRVSLHGDQGYLDPVPGTTILVTGHLSGPSRPTEPFGFDFQRHAWFERLGAVGYARTPALVLTPPAGADQWLGRFRQWLSGAVRERLPGQVGAFAAAVTTGDRAELSRETLQNMRDSNLAHLLAISGLHVGLLTGFVFSAIRGGLALVPSVAMRGSAKKWAAVGALMAAAAYLGLSGGTVSTQRAFLMVSVMLVAVMLDRRALTLRSVAVAATLILILRPEAVMGAGFQMSFAATTALVWVFSELRRFPMYTWPKWVRGLSTLVISSLVAGLATAPFGAAHFNQMASYGLIANLSAVPLMGILVIPSAVLAACLSPFGLAWVGLWLMGLGIQWILWVAEFVAEMDGAVRYIPQPGQAVLPLLVLGALWLILWQGRARVAGLVPMVAAFWLWAGHERPDLLIADSGGLVGVLTYEGRALNKARGDGFSARSWLEGDGDGGVNQEKAHLRAADLSAPGRMRFGVDRLTLQIRSGRGVETDTICDGVDVVIVNKKDLGNAPCLVIGPEVLRDTGALSVVTKEGEIRVTSVVQVSGQRVWNTPVTRRWIYGQADKPKTATTERPAWQTLQVQLNNLAAKAPSAPGIKPVIVAGRAAGDQ